MACKTLLLFQLAEKCNSEAKRWQAIEEISKIENKLDFKNCKVRKLDNYGIYDCI